MASRPQRSWPGKLTPTLGPWWPGRRFRCFIRCLHRKGPWMASRPQRSWAGKLTPTLGPWWPGRRFRCFIRCLHRKGPRMASRPQRFWQRRSAWYFFSLLLGVFSTCFDPRPRSVLKPRVLPQNERSNGDRSGLAILNLNIRSVAWFSCKKLENLLQFPVSGLPGRESGARIVRFSGVSASENGDFRGAAS